MANSQNESSFYVLISKVSCGVAGSLFLPYYSTYVKTTKFIKYIALVMSHTILSLILQTDELFV